MISLRTKILTAATLVSGALVVAVDSGGLMGQQITPPNVPSKPAAVATPPKGPETRSGYIMPEMLRSRVQTPWEYKIVNQDVNTISEEAFNKFGQDGWEYCTTLSGNPGRTLFKRPRTNPALASIALDMNAPVGMGPGMTIGPPGMPGMGPVQSIPPTPAEIPSGSSGPSRGLTPDPRSRIGSPGAAATASKPNSRDRNTHEEADSEETAIIPLKHAQASDMMRTIASLFVDNRPRVGPGMQGRSSDPKIAVDSRTNSLILIGQKRQLDKIRELIKQLDVETKKSRQDPVDPEKAQPLPDPEEAQPISNSPNG